MLETAALATNYLYSVHTLCVYHVQQGYICVLVALVCVLTVHSTHRVCVLWNCSSESIIH